MWAATAAAALAAPASTVTLPDGYRVVQAELVPGCGADVAQTITNLVWDVDIHKDWITRVEARPELARAFGDGAWHRYWISVYQHTITLLLRQCRPGTAAPPS